MTEDKSTDVALDIHIERVLGRHRELTTKVNVERSELLGMISANQIATLALLITLCRAYPDVSAVFLSDLAKLRGGIDLGDPFQSSFDAACDAFVRAATGARSEPRPATDPTLHQE